MLLKKHREIRTRQARRRKSQRRWALLTAGGLVMLGLAYAYFPRGGRGEPWEYWADAESAGFSEAGLQNVVSYTEALGTTGLVVVKGGKVLLEYGDIEARGYMAEGRYSIAAMVFGKPVMDGTIDLGLTLAEMGIDDKEGLLPREKQATIRDLLTFRSGVYHPTEFGDPEEAPPRGSVEPGSRFHFSSWDGLALKPVFELLTDRTLFQAIGEDLGHPLGLQDFNWKRQNPGHERTRSYFTVYNLYVSTRDVARFGQLMLQKGEWKGEQLIPREWVEEMTTIVTPAEELYPEEYRSRGMGFGYMWWIWQDPDPEGPYVGAYTYTGSYGQYLTVVPKLDMVVAHQVFAGWFGPPDVDISWEEYQGILDRLVVARYRENADGCG
jgi:CubicO group peptidase (beta-lactamase class C family)